MPQSTISKQNVQYLLRHPLLSDLLFLALKEGSLTASEAAKKTGLSIQSTTNALKELEEDLGFLNSRKDGRVRTYAAVNPEKLRSLMDSVATSIDPKKYQPGTRIFVPESFKNNLYEELGNRPKLSRFTMETQTPIETEVLDFDIELVFRQQKGKPAIAAFNQIFDNESCLVTLGKILLLSSVKDAYSKIILVNIFVPKLSTNIKTWTLEKIARPLFEHSFTVIEHHVGSEALLDVDFAKRIAGQIEASLT